MITADSASYDTAPRRGGSRTASSRVIAGAGQAGDVSASAPCGSGRFSQTPADLLAEAKAPDEMRYAELGRYIDALQRSGNDANKLMVERALKLALPATCLIIALFGAPLAITIPRAGAAVGIAHQPGDDRALSAAHPDHQGGRVRAGW